MLRVIGGLPSTGKLLGGEWLRMDYNFFVWGIQSQPRVGQVSPSQRQPPPVFLEKDVNEGWGEKFCLFLSLYKSASSSSPLHLYFPDLFLPCSRDPSPEQPPWEVRPCQLQCLFIPPSSSPTTPFFKHSMGCLLCLQITSPTSTASAPCTLYTCTSGHWGTQQCICPAPPSLKCPVCQAWWMHGSSCRPSHSSHMSSSPSKRPPMWPLKPNPALTLPT